MRNPILFFTLLTFLILAIDIYTYQAIKAAFKNWSIDRQQAIKIIHYSISALVIISALSWPYVKFFHTPGFFRTYFFAIVFLIYFSKVFILLFLLIEDFFRIIQWMFKFFQPKYEFSGDTISRNQFVSRIALFFGLLPLVVGINGMISNAYNYRFRRIKVYLPDLPEGFENLKIIQLSDIHSGSFTRTKPIESAIEKINNEAADFIFFTGDLVNNIADELKPYQKIFSQLKAKEGIYSVLGNHDYGDYFKWKDKAEKKANFQQLLSMQKEMGWRLLMDEHVLLNRGGDSIAIIGVQNWSAKMNFPKYGDLQKAYSGCEEAKVKFLLSHDPSHWDAEIKPKFPDIDFTFSGHTHGAQLGVEIPGIRWSPSKYFYKQWADLYQDAQQYLYVNRGFGFIGYPGRIGIMPEVSIFEFHKS